MNLVLLVSVQLGLPVLLYFLLVAGFLFVCEIALMYWGMKWPYALRAALRIMAIVLILGTVRSLGP